MIIETCDATFGRNVRYLRMKYALSLRALAKLTDISVYGLKELETNPGGAIFTDRTLRRMCQIFRVSVEDMMHRELYS